jgi:hypothetical protein
MVAWTGLGFLGFIFIFAAFIGVHEMYGSYYLFSAKAWVVILASVPCYVVGRLLNRDVPRKFLDFPRSEIDPQTKQPIHHHATGHTLAFVRLEYAGVFAILILIVMRLEKVFR